MSDHEVDHVLALAGFEELQDERMEKLNKHFWGKLSIPFTLNEGLHRYPKYQLDQIRKELNIQKASQLRKGELVARLEEEITSDLYSLISLWDEERFNLLAKMANNHGYITIPDEMDLDQIDYLRRHGVVYSGVVEEKKVLAMPQELTEQIKSFKDNMALRKTLKRNTEWILLTRGLLYYYGALTINQLIDMIFAHTKKDLDLLEYLTVIHTANHYHEEMSMVSEGYAHIEVVDAARVKQEHQARGNVDFYPFTKQQLLKAGEPMYVERNQSYLQFSDFLLENFEMDKQEVEDLTEESVYIAKLGESPNNVMQLLGEHLEFDSIETVQLVMNNVTQLMNNTKRWFLKGYTPSELAKHEEKQLLSLPTSTHGPVKKTVKVGRNDPCPCGSGKKYKKCCGG